MPIVFYCRTHFLKAKHQIWVSSASKAFKGLALAASAEECFFGRAHITKSQIAQSSPQIKTFTIQYQNKLRTLLIFENFLKVLIQKSSFI